MLSGVLVVAFPVSVFSDLWSEELKEVKGFDDLLHGDNGDENDTNDAPNRRPQTSSNRNSDFLLDNPDYVVMEKADFTEIVASLHTIRQEQQQIKRLLKKYYSAD